MIAKLKLYKSDYSQGMKTHRFGEKSNIPDPTEWTQETFLGSNPGSTAYWLLTLNGSLHLLVLQFSYLYNQDNLRPPCAEFSLLAPTDPPSYLLHSTLGCGRLISMHKAVPTSTSLLALWLLVSLANWEARGEDQRQEERAGVDSFTWTPPHQATVWQ